MLPPQMIVREELNICGMTGIIRMKASATTTTMMTAFSIRLMPL